MSEPILVQFNSAILTLTTTVNGIFAFLAELPQMLEKSEKNCQK